MSSSYQPFLIGEFKTGLYNYLKPWRRPSEAFEPLVNAHVYRGTLNKRNGYTLLGRLQYRDSSTIATGSGASSYSGTIASSPIIVAGTFTIYATVGASLETWTDNGDGTLTGSLGDSGTITYSTGAWSITLLGGRTVASSVPIVGVYTYINTANNPIMGLKQWQNANTGSTVLIAFDTKRASTYSSSGFSPVNTVSEQIGKGGGGTTVNFSTGFGHIIPYTFQLVAGSVIAKDDGQGNLTGTGVAAASTINYTSGAVTINFSVANSDNFVETYQITGNYFTGNYTNFINSVNWLGKMYLTNNHDPVTTFDGTNLGRPPFGITQANVNGYINDINTCLDIEVYKNRLLFLRPTTNAVVEGQTIRWSAISNPTNFAQDVAGNGGFLAATSGDLIQSAEYIRDTLAVFFQGETFLFRFTGLANAPFTFTRINTTQSCSAPYGSIPYDQRITAMGNRGLIACDGVNVQRYDVPIIDAFTDILQSSFGQCFGQRFDTLNRSWMLYPSLAQDNASSPSSDSALIYNFIENTWAQYQFDSGITFSCLGIWTYSNDRRWSYFANGGHEPTNWEDANWPWDNFATIETPILAGGDSLGNVYVMDDVTSNTDNGTLIQTNVISNLWNPFVEQGLQVQFGYIDIYYTTISDASNPESAITLNFFADTNEDPVLTTSMNLTGTNGQGSAWQRIYLNLTGPFLQMQISSGVLVDNALTLCGPFEIQGIILWARPAGRLTP